MSGEPSGHDSPVERYLDALTRLLSAGHPRELRYLLSETEAHLRDDTATAMAAGMSAVAAEEQAVRRLGPPEALARAELDRQRPALRDIVRRTAISAVVLGGLGAVAVGVSGVIAAIIRAAGGAGAVADAGHSILSPADCARWLAADPGAHTCRQAATADWAAETIYYRIAFGVLGLLALALVAVLRQRAPRAVSTQLPRVVVDTIAATAFAAAAGWTLALGIDALVVSSAHGWGQWLSATPVALAGAIVFAVRTVQDLRDDGVQPVRVRG